MSKTDTTTGRWLTKTSYWKMFEHLLLLNNSNLCVIFLGWSSRHVHQIKDGSHLFSCWPEINEMCYRLRRVPLVEQELSTLPGHLCSPSVFSGVRVTRSLVLCVMFCRSLFALLSFFLLASVLSILLWFTNYDYPFGISKLFYESLLIHISVTDLFYILIF